MLVLLTTICLIFGSHRIAKDRPSVGIARVLNMFAFSYYIFETETCVLKSCLFCNEVW